MVERELHSAWIVEGEPPRISGAATALFPWWSFTKTALVASMPDHEGGNLGPRQMFRRSRMEGG